MENIKPKKDISNLLKIKQKSIDLIDFNRSLLYYIKKNNLVNQDDITTFSPNQPLKKILIDNSFNEKLDTFDKISFFHLQKFVHNLIEKKNDFNQLSNFIIK